MQTQSIAFFGTPHLAVFVLDELEQTGITPSVVVTSPDKPAGRGLTLTPPPVKEWAQERDIPVLQPASLKQREQCPELANTEWDLFIVAAYNIILPEWVLALPKRQVLNVHPSMLPKLRGPSPVRSAILRDERDAVGVTIIKLDTEVDHGPIVAQATIELPEWPIPGSVLDELLFREGGRLLAEAIPLWCAGAITPEEQDHSRATYTHKFERSQGEIDLESDGYQNYLKYCAFDGWPGVFTFGTTPTGTPLRLKITEVAYVDGEFRVLRVVPEGKKEMTWEEWIRSNQRT